MTSTSVAAPPRFSQDEQALLVVAFYSLVFLLFGIAMAGPTGAFSGVLDIVSVRDTLVTDYIGVGGLGGAFANTGILTLVSCLVYYRAGAKIGGASIACLFLVLGFGLFGKNLLNVWGIILGVYLYCRFKKEPFGTHINTAFFGAALSPIFSEILFSSTLPLGVRIPLAGATTLVIGFVLVPVAAQLFKAHMGFSLYNMGFTAGIVGTVVVAVYKSYGFVPDPVFIWSTGNNALLGTLLFVVFASMLGFGLVLDRDALRKLLELMRLSGQAPTDFRELFGLGPTLVNMSLTGAIATTYVLFVGDLNGPTIGAILTIVGFSAFGKHPRNIVPIMAGIVLGSLFKPWNISDPSIVLAALFGTTLAPIAGRFGWHWGIVAGFLHSSVALSVGFLHGGLNLYNNGFAAGIVASVLVPIILAVRVPEDGKEEPEG